MDVPPFIHRKTEYPLAPEGTRPCWISDENWNKLRAEGILGEGLKDEYIEEQALVKGEASECIDPETGLIIGSLEYLYYCETGIVLGADT